MLRECEKKNSIDPNDTEKEYDNTVFYSCDFPRWDEIFYDTNLESMTSNLEFLRKKLEAQFKKADDYYKLRVEHSLPSANADLISMYYFTRIYIYHNLVMDLRKYVLPRYEKALQKLKDRMGSDRRLQLICSGRTRDTELHAGLLQPAQATSL